MKLESSQPNLSFDAKRAGIAEMLTLHCGRLQERYPVALQSCFAIFDQAIVSGTSFLTAVLIGRTVSQAELGMYYLVLSVILVITAAQEQIVVAPYLVYSKRRRGRELAEYSGSLWLHHFTATLVMMTAIFAATVVTLRTGPAGVVPGMWALLVATPLLQLRQCVRRYMFAHLKLVSAVAFDSAVAILQLGGLVLLVYFESLTLITIFTVMGVASLVACIGWYCLDPPRVRILPQRFGADFLQNWAFGKWALQGYIVGQTTPQVMLWILGVMGGAAATGVLGACATLIGVVNILLLGLDNVLTPQVAQAFAAAKLADARRILVRAAAFLGVTFGLLCIALLLTGDWAMILTFGPQFQGTGAILFVLSMNALMAGFGVVSGSGLRAIDQPRLNAAADVVYMVTSLVSAAFLIVPYGALGAALAILAGTSSSAITRTLTLTQHLKHADFQPNVTGEVGSHVV